MRIGMVGLGRMGANMTRRLVRGGHEVVVFDVSAEAVQAVVADGAEPAASIPDLAARLDGPRAVWVMVPAGDITESTVTELGQVLASGDTIIDGGNSRYTDSRRRAASLAERGISFIDVGTSGGIWGLDEGFCLMAGGGAGAVERLLPVFETLAPPDGFAHVGASGAGHFTKMVHNGIEYALLQAYGEGFELMEKSDLDLDLGQIAELWRHGSVVRSWLLELLASALTKDPDLASIAGYVEDSGEGRWTVESAIDSDVPVPTIALALFARFASRQDDSFSAKVIAALRNEFGGHVTKTEGE